MKKFCAFAAVCALALLVAAAGRSEDKAAGSAASLDTVKKLAGDWVAVGKDGKPTEQLVSSMRVTANGSAVLEILFPGSSHEMVSMYHRDGKDLVMTHYCALGNQPRMRATTGSDAKKIVFKFDGGTNLNAAKDSHMHEGTLTIIDDDHLTSEWTRCEDGKACEVHKMNLVRKGKK